MGSTIIGIIPIVAGTYFICCGLFGWSFFMDDWRMRPLVKWLGRTGTRIFYVVGGGIFVVLGIRIMLQ
jgi:hypothetical protein